MKKIDARPHFLLVGSTCLKIWVVFFLSLIGKDAFPQYDWNQSIINEAIGQGLVEWEPKSIVSYNGNMKKSKALHTLSLIAFYNPELSSSSNGKSVSDRVVDHFKNFLQAGKEPDMRGALYNSWVDCHIALSIALAKQNVAVWNRLSPDDKNRLDFLMQVFAVVGHYSSHYDNTRKFDIPQIYQSQIDWNPNHTDGNIITMIACAAYFGGEEEVDDILMAFDFDTYMAQAQGFGFTNIMDGWTHRTGNNGTKRLMDEGGNENSGGRIVKINTPYSYKHKVTKARVPFDDFLLYQALAERFFKHPVTDKSESGFAYTLKNGSSPVLGQEGMAFEFQARDQGGNQPYPNLKERSSLKYVYDGVRAHVAGISTMMALGLWEGTPSDLQDVNSRVKVGLTDMIHKGVNGYRGINKGAVEEIDEDDLSSKGYTMDKEIVQTFIFPNLEVSNEPQPELELYQTQLFFDVNSETKESSYSSSGPISISASQNWIGTELRENENKILISVQANPTSVARSGEVRVSNGNLQKTISITQSGMENTTPSDFGFDQSVLDQAMSRSLTEFRFFKGYRDEMGGKDGNSTLEYIIDGTTKSTRLDGGLYTTKAIAYMALVCYYNPDARGSNGRLVKDRLIDHLLHLVKGGEEPLCRGGGHAGHTDGTMVSALLLAKMNNDVWQDSRMNNQVREKLSWLMRFFTAAANFSCNYQTDNKDAYGLMRTPLNLKSYNPNLTFGYAEMMIHAAYFFEGMEGKAGIDYVNDMLIGYDFDTWRTQANDLGFSNIDKAMDYAINDPDGWKKRKDNPKAFINETIKRAYTYQHQYPSREKFDLSSNGNTPPFVEADNSLTEFYPNNNGEADRVPYDLFELAFSLNYRNFYHKVVDITPSGRGHSLSDTPNPYLGQRGMLLEYLTDDTGGERTATKYVHESVNTSIYTMAIMHIKGDLWKGPSNKVNSIRPRMAVGMADFFWKAKYGWYGTQHGGSPSRGSSHGYTEDILGRGFNFTHDVYHKLIKDVLGPVPSTPEEDFSTSSNFLVFPRAEGHTFGDKRAFEENEPNASQRLKYQQQNPVDEYTLSKHLSIYATGDWTLESDQNWIFVSKTSGRGNDLVVVSVSPNTHETQFRSGSLTLRGTNQTRTISVSQSALDQRNNAANKNQPIPSSKYLHVSTYYHMFTDVANDFDFYVTANVNWSVSENVDWLEISESAGNQNKLIRVTVNQNAGASRSVTLQFSSPETCNGDGACKQEVRITQLGNGSHVALDPQDLPNGETSGFTFQSKIFLEGLLENNGMRTSLVEKNLLPSEQPFRSAPWNYQGSESISSFPESAVDWLLVNIRDASYNILAQQAVLVLSDGSLASVSGGASIQFPQLSRGPHFVSFHHRSHLAILSAQPISHNTRIDLTQSVDVVSGIEQLKMIAGKATMIAGDYDQNGLINNADFNLWKVIGAEVDVYKNIDGDGNGIINNQDFNFWRINSSKVGIPELRNE